MSIFDYLRIWSRHVRLWKVIRWGLLGFSAGLVVGIGFGLFFMALGRVAETQYAAIVCTGALLGALTTLLAALLWPWSNIEQAQYFDRHYHLQERMSTAVEISEGSIQPPSILAERQLDDTIRVCSTVSPRQQMPYQLPVKNIGFACLLILFGALPFFLGNDYFNVARKREEIRESIKREAAQVESIYDQVLSDEALEPNSHEAILSPLEETLTELQEATTFEQAIASLEKAEADIRELSDGQVKEWAQRLSRAAEGLHRQGNGPLKPFAEHLSQGNYSEAAKALESMDLSTVDESTREKLIQQLSDLAEGLREVDPELAKRMTLIAEALSRSEVGVAQQELGKAAQALGESARELTDSNLAGEVTEELRQARMRLLEHAQELGSEGSFAALEGGSQSVCSEGSTQNANANQVSGGGAGSGSEEHVDTAGSETGNQPIATGNNPEETGERTYVPLGTSNRLEGEQGPTVVLPGGSDSEDVILGLIAAPITLGDGVRVSYEEVFIQYERYASQAITHLQPPPHLEAVVWRYFTSIAP
jgi:hypothetical protein